MKAFIYGHSQTGGMGLDAEKALKKAGYAVERITRVGYGDGKLLKEAPSTDADLVVLFAGGNTDTANPTAIRSLVDHFGQGRTLVVLSPVCSAYAKADALRARNAGNVAGLGTYVRVYSVEAGPEEFQPDKIHMKAGSPSSTKLAQRIVADLQAKPPQEPPPSTDQDQLDQPAPTTSSIGVLLVAVLLLWLLRRRT